MEQRAAIDEDGLAGSMGARDPLKAQEGRGKAPSRHEARPGGGAGCECHGRQATEDGPDAAVNLKVKVHATATTRDLDDFMFFALLQGGLSDISSFEDTLTKADDFFVGVDSSTELIAEMNKAETQRKVQRLAIAPQRSPSLSQ